MLRLDPLDTIAAIATPPGPAARGVVRLSGPDAHRLALGCFECSPLAANIRPGVWLEGRLRVAGVRAAIPAVVAFWRAPRTYTGQPLAEIHAPGSRPILQGVLADLLARGARLAEPGEFTLRAFLNGRIDLTQSEAVRGVIDAATPAQLTTALRQLAGGLASPITALRDRLLDTLAHLEANLDFADEPDVDPLGRLELAEELNRGSREVARLASQLRGRDRAEGRPRVVLVGPPNAGKSRLFNALVGQERALVSAQAGTTRDYLEAPCDCDGLTIDLVDTAGLEPGAEPIGQQAQSASLAQAEAASLLLVCETRDAPAQHDTSLPGAIPTLRVWTKCDLSMPEDLTGVIVTSAQAGLGLDVLRRAVADRLRDQHAGEAVASTSARCGDSLQKASASLESAADAIRLGLGDELVAVDLRQTLDELGRVVGTVVTDDLLDRIFRRFCIGK